MARRKTPSSPSKAPRARAPKVPLVPRKSAPKRSASKTSASKTSASRTSPLISICVPTYKRVKYIETALNSCLAQTYDNYEIIVHDDTQDDGIKTIVESYDSDKIRYYQNKPAMGLVPKLNDFLDKVRGDWIIILCDDDFLEPEYLATMTAHLKTYPDAALLRCRYRLVDSQGDQLRLDREGRLLSRPTEFLRDIFLREDKNFKMNISGIMFRGAMLKARGGFNELYRAWHVDRLAWIKLGAMGNTVCDPAVMCNIRLHTDSMTATFDANYRLALETDLEMQSIIENVFDELSDKLDNETDRSQLQEARENCKKYIARHMERSIDQGFVSVLEEKRYGVGTEVEKIFATMRELEVSPFRSYFIYRVVVHLPYFLRSLIVSQIKLYKQRKMT